MSATPPTADGPPNEAPSGNANAPKPVTVEDYEDVPDPDEDDLDDLDGKSTRCASAYAASSFGTASASAAAPSEDDPILSEEEFAKQLQAGMADLLGELEKSPEMQAQFESIFKELSSAAAESAEQASTSTPEPSATAGPSTTTPPNAGATPSFQETIRRTMERMQTSGEQATAAAAAGGASDDFMAELLRQMQSGGLDGAGSEEEFSKMLMGMMEQLTNKEILYEPMKELDDKFPEWMDKNREKTSAEDMKRYEEQRTLVREIVLKFEEATYSDANPTDREYIIDRMQKMQATGSPPSDLVGDMPSAQDVLNMPDDSCNPQ
ncbi:hypothetical protein VTJ49DRAFT_7567 [Mycothermus thermophilus]|uniref:Uncharacterized protein n=1 Tax=Humicola insolens TaxID=85995 RepID=A0ABR3VJ58_HUMIN